MYSYNLVDDDEIVCFLHGDDWLYDNCVFRVTHTEYMDDIHTTFGSYCNLKMVRRVK